MKNKKLLKTKTIECPACRQRTPGSQVFQVKIKDDLTGKPKDVTAEVDLPRFSFFRYIFRLHTYSLKKGIDCKRCGYLIAEGKADY